MIDTFTSNLKNKLEQSFSTFSSLTINNSVGNSSTELTSATGADTEAAATTVLLPPIEMSLEEQRALGYMPLRDDFEREFRNDAETLLSNLTIANNQLVLLNNSTMKQQVSNSSCLNTPGAHGKAEQQSLDPDDVVDFDLKITLIQMYRECLIERQRYKMIAREYGLVNNASALLNKQKVLSGTGVVIAPNGMSSNHVSNKKRRKIITEDKEMR